MEGIARGCQCYAAIVSPLNLLLPHSIIKNYFMQSHMTLSRSNCWPKQNKSIAKKHSFLLISLLQSFQGIQLLNESQWCCHPNDTDVDFRGTLLIVGIGIVSSGANFSFMHAGYVPAINSSMDYISLSLTTNSKRLRDLYSWILSQCSAWVASKTMINHFIIYSYHMDCTKLWAIRFDLFSFDWKHGSWISTVPSWWNFIILQ